MFQFYETPEKAVLALSEVFEPLCRRDDMVMTGYTPFIYGNEIIIEHDAIYHVAKITVFPDRTEFTDVFGDTLVTAYPSGIVKTNLPENVASYSSYVLFRLVTERGSEFWEGMEEGRIPPMLRFPEEIPQEDLRKDREDYLKLLAEKGIPFMVVDGSIKVLL